MVARITFVFRRWFSTNYFSGKYAIIASATGPEMRLPHFASRNKFDGLSKQDEKVFAEASELALLRLEQCIADLRISVPILKDSIPPRGHQLLRKYTNLF